MEVLVRQTSFNVEEQKNHQFSLTAERTTVKGLHKVLLDVHQVHRGNRRPRCLERSEKKPSIMTEPLHRENNSGIRCRIGSEDPRRGPLEATRVGPNKTGSPRHTHRKREPAAGTTQCLSVLSLVAISGSLPQQARRWQPQGQSGVQSCLREGPTSPCQTTDHLYWKKSPVRRCRERRETCSTETPAGNHMLEEKEKEIEAHTLQRRKQRPQAETVRTSSDITHGLNILRSESGSISHKSGYQAGVKQLVITRPARVMSGDFVSPCGEFTKSKDQEDAQLVRRIEPNSTTHIVSACVRI